MGNSCSGRQDAEPTGGADAEPTGGAEADPAATSTTQQQGQQQARDSEVLLEILQLLKKIEERDERREKRDERRDERIQTNARKSAGGYFVTTGALWGKAYIKDVAADKSCKDAVSRITERIKEFPLIDCKPKDEESRNAEGGKLSIPHPKWCLEMMRQEKFNGFEKDQNIFFTSVTKAREDNAPGQKSLAHSVPVDGICSVFWPPYVPLLTGASGDDTQRFFAVHGRMRDETQYTDIENKGIKNVAQNLLALPPDHETFYDGSGAGSLIIIPIVDLDKSVDYLKENRFYDLLVVGKSKSVYNWIYNGAVPGTADIYSESLDATVEDANEHDITIATKFLNYYAKAAAYIAVTDVKPELSSDEAGVFQKMYEKMDPTNPARSETSSRKSRPPSAGQVSNATQKLQQQISTISKALEKIESEGLRVPEVRQGFDFKNKKVLKVKLKQYFEDVNLDLKLYPTWGPLGMKATANWLVFADQALIPSCMDRKTVPVPSIEIGGSSSGSNGSDVSNLSSGESDYLSLGSMCHAISSPRETRIECYGAGLFDGDVFVVGVSEKKKILIFELELYKDDGFEMRMGWRAHLENHLHHDDSKTEKLRCEPKERSFLQVTLFDYRIIIEKETETASSKMIFIQLKPSQQEIVPGIIESDIKKKEV